MNSPGKVEAELILSGTWAKDARKFAVSVPAASLQRESDRVLIRSGGKASRDVHSNGCGFS